MKTKILALLLGIGFLLLYSCKSDQDIAPDGPGEVIAGNGISPEDLDPFTGEIGIIINARSLAQRGRFPKEAVVSVKAPSGTLKETIPLDPFAYMGLLKFPVDGISQDQAKQLTDGVPVEVTLKDEAGEDILTNHNLGTLSFLANPTPTKIETNINETFDFSTLMINEGTGVYLQQVNSNGTPLEAGVRWFRQSATAEMTVSANDFMGNKPDFVFQLTPVPERRNNFYIQLKSNGDYFSFTRLPSINSIPLVIHTAPRKTTRKTLNGLSFAERTNYFFQLFKVSDGVYRLLTHDGKRVK
ncbi:hypothetical protein MMU07_14470 [Aquiflexum sp. LQ15W]|uniref:hypothetical protein n=1 Tax=Cognataquiflexum nitidum TaxID=2922272 RepID=UPI001F1437EF|nr:hypothetical protein [Cognataquiflexum nitidum]MCH6200786.1 hypothetical protein [Cognataquiflexum nitidum]